MLEQWMTLMVLPAQIIGGDEAIAAARATENWVIVLLVALVVSGFGCFGLLIQRQAKRADETEAFVRTTLMDAMRHAATSQLTLADGCRKLAETIEAKQMRFEFLCDNLTTLIALLRMYDCPFRDGSMRDALPETPATEDHDHA